MLPKISTHVKTFNETNNLSFFIRDNELLKKYKKDLRSKPVYNQKYLKTKIKSYESKVIK